MQLLSNQSVAFRQITLPQPCRPFVLATLVLVYVVNCKVVLPIWQTTANQATAVLRSKAIRICFNMAWTLSRCSTCCNVYGLANGQCNINWSAQIRSLTIFIVQHVLWLRQNACVYELRHVNVSQLPSKVCLQYWHCFSRNLGVNAVHNAIGGETSERQQTSMRICCCDRCC